MENIHVKAPFTQVKAPFTDEQVKNLNDFQVCGFHEFTCGSFDHPREADNVLIATNDGWTCPNCDYTQEWAHASMCDGSMASAMREFLNIETRQAFLIDDTPKEGEKHPCTFELSKDGSCVGSVHDRCDNCENRAKNNNKPTEAKPFDAIDRPKINSYTVLEANNGIDGYNEGTAFVMDAVDGNRLIAEFIWGQPEDEVWYRNKPVLNTITLSGISHHIEQLCFNTSWDWLMPVVEKIEELGEIAFQINNNRASIYHTHVPIIQTADDTKIKATYQAVTEFIKWYNLKNS